MDQREVGAPFAPGAGDSRAFCAGIGQRRMVHAPRRLNVAGEALEGHEQEAAERHGRSGGLVLAARATRAARARIGGENHRKRPARGSGGGEAGEGRTELGSPRIERSYSSRP